jgi:exodeoxyribonuclease VII small subunit
MSEKFEDILKELEEIVSKLESGECGLDESIELYAKGSKLSAVAKQRLEEARQRLEKLNDYTE